MYSLSDLQTVGKEPMKLLREINRLYYTKLRTWEYNQAAPNVFEEDWDNLLILDACRYDTFRQTAGEFELPGETKYNFSRGASTMEFLRANLPGQDLSDTVYVTATSMLYRMVVLTGEIDHNLHAVVDVWEDAIDIGEWGVRPERVAEKVREVDEMYPDKRLVVHFIQPHIPFIGEFGRSKFQDQDIWGKMLNGHLDAEDADLRQAYTENLRVVLPSAKDLLTDLSGKSVVTADHGQLIGDRGFPIPFREYGHPNGIYCDELVKVPWHVHENGSRKRIVASDSRGERYDRKDDEQLSEKAEEHLQNLGYLQ